MGKGGAWRGGTIWISRGWGECRTLLSAVLWWGKAVVKDKQVMNVPKSENRVGGQATEQRVVYRSNVLGYN